MIYVVGLGANLGTRLSTLRAVTRLLDIDPLTSVAAVSRVYETPPLGPPQPDFLNAAIRVETRRSPHELLALCGQIETGLGRVRRVRWGPRSIDIDLLSGPHAVSDPPRLELPHPHLHERAFARVPWAEVAPPEQVRPVPASELDPTPWTLWPNSSIHAVGNGPDRLDALALALTSVGKGEDAGAFWETGVSGFDEAVTTVERLRADGQTFVGVTMDADESGGFSMRLAGLSPGEPKRLDLRPVVIEPHEQLGWTVRLGRTARSPASGASPTEGGV